MRIQLVIAASALLAWACRQPNPEWQGRPGEDDGTTAVATTADPTTAVATTADPSSTATVGSTAATEGVDGTATTTAVDDTTEGQDCNNDNQCPDGFVCGPMGCQDGSEGDPCTNDMDCLASTGLCGPMGCQDGNEGDPCDGGFDCAPGVACIEGVCGPPND